MTMLEELIAAARKIKMSDEERETQRQSFAYGNTHFENENITRETVVRASQILKGQTHRETKHCTGQSDNACSVD
ncbi:hypothetical protein [Schlesneria sp. DSM 10557]|uniref:hypothetical protein n=1 Tax=Schlesneria sp. DSM 10557 TaxID=3044399 RepID=UPI0035A1B3BD